MTELYSSGHFYHVQSASQEEVDGLRNDLEAMKKIVDAFIRGAPRQDLATLLASGDDSATQGDPSVSPNSGDDR